MLNNGYINKDTISIIYNYPSPIEKPISTSKALTIGKLVDYLTDVSLGILQHRKVL